MPNTVGAMIEDVRSVLQSIDNVVLRTGSIDASIYTVRQVLMNSFLDV